MLTKSGGRCWNGTASNGFDVANCGTPIALTLTGGVWVSNQLTWMSNNGQPNFNSAGYSLDVTVRDAAGNTTTTPTRSFSVNGA